MRIKKRDIFFKRNILAILRIKKYVSINSIINKLLASKCKKSILS